MKFSRQNPTQPKWMMLIVYLILLLFALGAFIGLRNCSSYSLLSSNLTQPNNNKEAINVAMIYSPLNYYMYDDTLGGYSYDLLRLISSKENQPINFVPINSFSEGLDKLHKGDVDMIASIPVNSLSEQTLIFTDSVYTDHLVLVYTLEGGREKIGSPFELARKKVHLASGDAALLRMRNLMSEIGDTIFLQQHSNLSEEKLTQNVAEGDFEFGIVNSRIADNLKNRYSNLATMPIGFTQLQSWVVKDTLLLNRMNNYLRDAGLTKERALLRKRYNL